MESNGKNVVYVRRGEGEKKSADWKDDGGKGLKRGGGVRRRLESKLNRKRGLKDVSLGVKKRQLSNNKSSGKNSDHMDDSPPGSRGPGRYKSVGDRRWKDASSDGEKRKGRVLNLKRSRDGDGSGSPYEERKEIVGRGKRSVRHFKGTKVADKGFSSSSKLKVRVGLNSSESLGKVKHHDGADNNSEGRIKKSSAAEPPKKRRHRLILDENSDDDDYYPRPAGVKKDVNTPRSPEAEGEDEAVNNVDEEISPEQQQVTAGIISQGVRKSSRVPKKKVLEDFEDDVPDVAGLGVAEMGESPEEDEKLEGGAESDSSDGKETGASGAEVSDSDPDLEYLKTGLAKAKLKRPKAAQDVLPVSQGKTSNAPLTARQRTMQLGKEGDANLGLNLIEFPAGLTTLSRRGTQKLTLEERQVKKAEAANRRKQVVERAANELQATAIQKILGQDSSRKRKEERLQRQREEIEQEKKAASKGLPSNIVRWTTGPQGQTVSWSEDVVLPNIFSAPLSGYPPCRQKCAAPTCSNPYNYRDSKSNLPLCSLRCYDAMRPTAAAALVS